MVMYHGSEAAIEAVDPSRIRAADHDAPSTACGSPLGARGPARDAQLARAMPVYLSTHSPAPASVLWRVVREVHSGVNIRQGEISLYDVARLWLEDQWCEDVISDAPKKFEREALRAPVGTEASMPEGESGAFLVTDRSPTPVDLVVGRIFQALTRLLVLMSLHLEELKQRPPGCLSPKRSHLALTQLHAVSRTIFPTHHLTGISSESQSTPAPLR